jgi:hypothetical protein
MSVTTFGYRYITESLGSVYTAHNQNILVKYVLDKGVLDRDEDTPPGSPSDGDAYVVAATATGAWAGHEDHIAYWFDEIGVWKFIIPDEGLHVYLADEDVQIKYLGGSSGWDVVAGSGTVTEVNGVGTVAGITLTGTVTGAGDLTLGGTLLVDLTSMVTGVLPLANMTGTTVGKNVLNLANPSAIRFLRLNADNSVDALSDSAFRTAIGVSAGGGTVTQVDGTGTVAGLTLTGTVTTTGNITLGGTLAVPIANITASTSDPIGVGSINLGHASDTTITRVSAGVAAIEGNTIVTRSPTIQSVSSSATVTPTFSDDLVKITAQAAGLTLANPTGTAIPGLGMVIRIKDNGTARSIGYDTQYRAIGVTLPTTTVISKTLYLAMVFNSDDTKWDVVAVGQEA